MADGQLNTVIGQLRRRLGRQSGCTLTDGQLLDDFVTRRDEAAFEVIVWRHGAMVFNLCKRLLHDSHEAEDAFQAAFLVFARKAGSIGKRESVGSWLYKVAYRVALRARAKAARRSLPTEATDEVPAREEPDDVVWRDLRPVLDEEIDRLPEKYRVPFVLCYLEGHTNEEAAEQLGCPKGTVLSRLSRGRERLRSRLALRGVGLSVAWLSTTLFPKAASAAAPTVLVHATVEAALPFAAGKAVTGVVSTFAIALAQGVLRSMLLTKLKIAAVLLLAVGFVVGANGIAAGLFAEKPAAPAADKGNGRVPRVEDRSPAIAGTVSAIGKDGKSFTLTLPATVRGEEPRKIAVSLDDKTAVTYTGIGPDGAKLTAGYHAQVRLAEGSPELAASVLFQGAAERGLPPDAAGKIVALARDGKALTLEIGSRRPREEEPAKLDVLLGDKTHLVFSNVASGGARLAEGQNATVWLAKGARGNTASVIDINGAVRAGRRDTRADVSGKIVAVTRDGKALTVETQPAGRGSAAKTIAVTIGDKAQLSYLNVGTDGAKPAEGYQIDAWLEEGSKDSAAQATIHGTANARSGPALLTGKVAAVSADGKEINLERPATTRGGPAEKIVVHISDRTRIAYFDVGPDGAKPTVGYQVQVRQDEGSKDASHILFTKPGASRR